MAASVHQRLLNLSRETGEDFQRVLDRYVAERFLYRLSRSSHSNDFILKGAMLFVAWMGQMLRPTRDLDLLGYGDPSAERIRACFSNICDQAADGDGLVFDADAVRVDPIREGQTYEGQRVRIPVLLGKARITLQVDVGFGDAVPAGLRPTVFPTLLDMPAPEVTWYPPEVVVAEKVHAMVVLGMANSRMKDFYDVAEILDRFTLTTGLLANSLAETFARRQTLLPADIPVAFTSAFTEDQAKNKQWKSFLLRNDLSPENSLQSVITRIADTILPALMNAREAGGRSETA
ncbi:MAG: nucleotidyl transferase AbiEii/AbiGii toxin family protein [Planctomycetota bacterium]